MDLDTSETFLICYNTSYQIEKIVIISKEIVDRGEREWMKIQRARERFQLLLQQLDLTEDAIVNYFIGAEIDKLSMIRSPKNGIFL